MPSQKHGVVMSQVIKNPPSINIGGGGGGIDTIKSAAFQYPRDRGRSDRDVWRSRNADFFYGYSNASTQFSKCESSDEKLLILGNRHQWWLEPSTNWNCRCSCCGQEF
ncbi:hypothetical protein Bca4012_063736 [Brassica carinata]